MSGSFQWVTIIPTLPILLVYLAGLIAAVILLVRKRGMPAILTLIGFGILFLTKLLGLFQAPLAGWMMRSNYQGFPWVSAGLGCCCSIFDVGAIICLIVALWQAVIGSKGSPPPPPPSPAHREVEQTAEVPSVAAPPPPARSYQTEMLAAEPEEAEWTEEAGATAKMADTVEPPAIEPEDATLKMPPAGPDFPRKTQVLGELLDE